MPTHGPCDAYNTCPTVTETRIPTFFPQPTLSRELPWGRGRSRRFGEGALIIVKGMETRRARFQDQIDRRRNARHALCLSLLDVIPSPFRPMFELQQAHGTVAEERYDEGRWMRHFLAPFLDELKGL